MKISIFSLDQCFVHPIFLSFGFWYFGHFSFVIYFPVFFCLAHLALQNVNKDYIIFSYFHIFFAKSDQKPKTKNGMNETQVIKRPNKIINRGNKKIAKWFWKKSWTVSKSQELIASVDDTVQLTECQTKWEILWEDAWPIHQ